MTAAPRPQLMPVDAIVAQLQARVSELVAVLFPAGVREGDEFRVGTWAGKPGRSIAVRLVGQSAGVWWDFAANRSGNVLDLVAEAVFRGDHRQAVAWAREWLSVGAPLPPRVPSDEWRRSRDARARAKAEATAAAIADRDLALRLWDEAVSPRGTIAEQYLRDLGVPLGTIQLDILPLRFHAALKQETGEPGPALLAAIANLRGQTVAVHRTWLRADLPGVVAIARSPLGLCQACSIQLWPGESRRPLERAALLELVELVAEIEDGLRLATVLPTCRVLVVISPANAADLDLPRNVAAVRIWLRDVPPNRALHNALYRAIRSHTRRGRRVLIAHLPAQGGDVGELIRTEAARSRDRAI